jgi:hypothetical protein
MTTENRSRILNGLCLGVALFASCAAILANSARLGATFDEPFYISKGLDHWRSGSYRTLMRAGTMPLPVDVQTLPLYIWERERGTPFNPIFDMNSPAALLRLPPRSTFGQRHFRPRAPRPAGHGAEPVGARGARHHGCCDCGGGAVRGLSVCVEPRTTVAKAGSTSRFGLRLRAVVQGVRVAVRAAGVGRSRSPTSRTQ